MTLTDATPGGSNSPPGSPQATPDSGPHDPASQPELDAAIAAEVARTTGTYPQVYGVKADLSDLQAKVTAAVATGGIVQIPATAATLPAIVSVPSDMTKKVTIQGTGVGATTIALTTTANAFVSMAKTNGAGSVLRNLTIQDLTLDASALVAGTAPAGTFGFIGPADGTDVSWSDIAIRRVVGVGAPVNPDISHQFFWVRVYSQTATAAALQTIKRITVEDFDFTGGENGVYIGAGRSQTGATDAPNITLDDIYCRRGRHVMPTPTGFLASNNFIFGHRGRGLKLRVADLYGYGCGDAGLEVNCWDDAVIDRCVVEDAYNSDFFHTHYNVSAAPSTQKLTYRDCTAKRTSYVPATFVMQAGQGYGWLQSDNPSFARPAPTRWENCKWLRATTDLTVDGEGILSFASRGVTIEDFLSDTIGIAYDANTAAMSVVHIRPGSGITTPVRIRRFRAQVAGAKGAGADRNWTALRFPFGNYELDIDGVEIDHNITGGVGATSCRAIWLGDDATATTLRGSLRRARYTRSPGDTSALLILVGPTNTTTIAPRFVIDDCDVRVTGDANASTISRELVRFRGTAGSTQHTTGLVIIRNSVPNGKYPLARATITPGASPYTYQNNDAMAQRVIINGGVVSSVAISQDNSEFFDLANAPIVRLEPGEFLKVVYSGTPSMYKIFEKT